MFLGGYQLLINISRADQDRRHLGLTTDQQYFSSSTTLQAGE
jgi:hypothetical protein